MSGEGPWPVELLGLEDAWSAEQRAALQSVELKRLGIYARWSLWSRAWGWALLGLFSGALIGATLARLGFFGDSSRAVVWVWALLVYPLVAALPLFLAGRRRGLIGAARALSHRDEVVHALIAHGRERAELEGLGRWLWGGDSAAGTAALRLLFDARDKAWWAATRGAEDLSVLRAELDRRGQVALGRAFWILVVLQALLPNVARYRF